MRVMVNILYLMNACYLNKTITSEREKKLLSPPCFPCFCKAFRAFKDNEVTIIITLIFFLTFFSFKFCKKMYNRIVVPVGFLPWEIPVAFPWENRLQHCRTTQPWVHAGYFSVSIIHHTLTWTTASLRCAQMLMHAIAHRGVWTP